MFFLPFNFKQLNEFSCFSCGVSLMSSHISCKTTTATTWATSWPAVWRSKHKHTPDSADLVMEKTMKLNLGLLLYVQVILSQYDTWRDARPSFPCWQPLAETGYHFVWLHLCSGNVHASLLAGRCLSLIPFCKIPLLRCLLGCLQLIEGVSSQNSTHQPNQMQSCPVAAKKQVNQSLCLSGCWMSENSAPLIRKSFSGLLTLWCFFRRWRMELWSSGCWDLFQAAVLKLDFRPVARLRTGCFPQRRTRWHTNLHTEFLKNY